MAEGHDLLAWEYEAVDAHLRANVGQFVNWFSLFLALALAALGAFAATADLWPRHPWLDWRYAVPGAFLFLHVLAFVGILTFRRYIAVADARLRQVAREAGAAEGRSPVPAGFHRWMTDLMAAGYVMSYFAWLGLLFFHWLGPPG